MNVYILTDCNRMLLHVGMAESLKSVLNSCKSFPIFCSDGSSTIRLVYQESCSSEEAALARFNELRRYTRMQKERLIRKSNPNWVDLARSAPHYQKVPMADPLQLKRSFLSAI